MGSTFRKKNAPRGDKSIRLELILNEKGCKIKMTQLLPLKVYLYTSKEEKYYYRMAANFYTLCLANNNKCESEKYSHVGQIEFIQLCNTSPLKDKVIVCNSNFSM